VENFIHYVLNLNPVWVLVTVFLIACIENLFPPSPSDILIVAAGSLVGIGTLGWVETLAVATAGSTVGFVAMYQVGHWFGDHILAQGKIRFIPVTAVQRVEMWFRRYGYWIIVVNRFLSGTRAVVSFFAGMSGLNLMITTVLCFLSALFWNALLIYGGYVLGANWRSIGVYLSTYSQVATGIVVVAVLVLVARFLTTRNSNNARG
jgi:membrane protein DedA with SNARE-associated domain